MIVRYLNNNNYHTIPYNGIYVIPYIRLKGKEMWENHAKDGLKIETGTGYVANPGMKKKKKKNYH